MLTPTPLQPTQLSRPSAPIGYRRARTRWTAALQPLSVESQTMPSRSTMYGGDLGDGCVDELLLLVPPPSLPNSALPSAESPTELPPIDSTRHRHTDPEATSIAIPHKGADHGKALDDDVHSGTKKAKRRRWRRRRLLTLLGLVLLGMVVAGLWLLWQITWFTRRINDQLHLSYGNAKCDAMTLTWVGTSDGGDPVAAYRTVGCTGKINIARGTATGYAKTKGPFGLTIAHQTVASVTLHNLELQ